MNYLTANWGYPWFAVLIVALIGVHERGLRSLNRRSTKAHARHRPSATLVQLLGPGVLAPERVIAPSVLGHGVLLGPHDPARDRHVGGASALRGWRPVAAPDTRAARAHTPTDLAKDLRSSDPSPASPAIRVPGLALGRGDFLQCGDGVLDASGVLQPDHDPSGLHIGLMLTTFFVSGLLFWIQFIPSKPLRPKLSPYAQVGSLLATNLIMTVIAITISFLVSVPSYDFNAMMMNMGSMSMPVITLNRLADQQIGAAILWVCGDFWCFPALTGAVRRLMKDGDVHM